MKAVADWDPFLTYGSAAFANARRAPFFRRKLDLAGIRDGVVPGLEAFRRIPPTTKEELRELTSEEFYRDLVIARPSEVATIWRSGGVTGRPLFYPRARADFDVLVESFVRGLDMVGVGPGDIMHNSFPLGTHPLGHMFCYAAQSMRVGCIPAGSGQNTPTEVQIQLMFDLRPTIWAGLASFLVHIGHLAESMGRSPRSAGLRLIINSGEPLTPAKRRRIESTWGARLVNCYGMSECSMMGCECEVGDGFHIWSDMFFTEVLDPDAGWAPVPDGEVGMIVVTPLHNSHATPFLRWASGDLGSLSTGCSCSGPYGGFPKLTLSGRTAGFSKVKGVNINHQEMEDMLLRVETLADFMVWVEDDGGRDRLRIEVELVDGSDPVQGCAAIAERVSATFEVRPEVESLPRGTVAKRLEGDVKQVRFRDSRG